MAKREKIHYLVVVVKNDPWSFPAAHTMLLNTGVPFTVAEKYRKVRWSFTTGLRRRVKRDVN